VTTSRTWIALGAVAAVMLLLPASAPVGGPSRAADAVRAEASPPSSREAESPPPSPALPPARQVIVGAGDIASCTASGDSATAKLLDGIDGTVYTLGDNAYPDGAAADFARCYDRTWGRHKARTRPAPGNHDYQSRRARPYFRYFGSSAGDPAKGYYSYDVGAWHVVVVNSNCGEVGGCQAGSAQERWLRRDLAASRRTCTLAYWHHPRFTSGREHGNATEMQPIWWALYDHGAEIVLSGHNHQYERFAPQTPTGMLDRVRGVRQFVVGTGGASHYGFGKAKPNSEVRNSTAFGVLKLTLDVNSYTWQFVSVAGQIFTDTGTGTCH
jgi:acid phosphatase type 7